MPNLCEKRIIKSFWIPRYVNNKWYWLKRHCYILIQYKRVYHGSYPDRWFCDEWVNLRLCTKSEYINYKYNKVVPTK